MRKVISLVVAMLLVPTMAMAMQSMSNGDMENVTGQAGVSIAVDDVKMYQNIQGLWYTDTDGINTSSPMDMHSANDAGGAASIGIDKLSVMVEVNAITGATSSTNIVSTGRSLQGNYDSNLHAFNTATSAGEDTAFMAKPINIDVTDALPVLSQAAANNAVTKSSGDQTVGASLGTADVAGVQIGLGTMEIYQSDLQFDVAMKDGTPLDDSSGSTLGSINSNANSDTPDYSYGKVTIEETTMAILDGSIEIAPH